MDVDDDVPVTADNVMDIDERKQKYSIAAHKVVEEVLQKESNSKLSDKDIGTIVKQIVNTYSWRIEKYPNHTIESMKEELEFALEAFLESEFPQFEKFAESIAVKFVDSVMKSTAALGQGMPRMVSVGYGITGTTLTHNFDLHRFQEQHVDNVFQEYSVNPQNYVGPYFCFVQSSGMGKTKIMAEYRKGFEAAESKSRCACKLVLYPAQFFSMRKAKEQYSTQSWISRR